MQIKHLLLTVFKVQDQNCLSSMLRPLLEHVLKQISNNRFQESHANLNAHMGIHSEFTKNHSPGLPFKVNRMAGGKGEELQWRASNNMYPSLYCPYEF